MDNMDSNEATEVSEHTQQDPSTDERHEDAFDRVRASPGPITETPRVLWPESHNSAQNEDAEDAVDDDEYDEDDEEQQEVCDWGDDGQNTYDLRPGARGATGLSSTWIDNDDTGLYDPSDERRKLRQRPQRRITVPKSSETWLVDGSEDESETKKAHAVQERPKLTVILKFESEASKVALEKVTHCLPAQLKPSEDSSSERRLRRRDSGVGHFGRLTFGAQKKHRLPGDLPQDLTGHPIARGCWECLTLGIRCPLLDDERAWPCTACVDDDHECELVVPPTYKRTCEHCKNRRQPCSYAQSLEHSEPCEECFKGGWDCIAGPAKESIQPRISYERDWKNDPYQKPKAPKVKELPTCHRCRELKQPCSFSAGDDGAECTQCGMASITCVRATGKAKPSRKRKRPEQEQDPQTGVDQEESLPHPVNADEVVYINSEDPPSFQDEGRIKDDRKSAPKKAAPKKSRSKGTVITITTKFAHPIVFNYDGNKPCHFCSDIRFEMFGLGECETEVVRWDDGRGLDEISGGHRGRGRGNTRMCIDCTTKRLPAILCTKHDIRRLSGAVNDPHLQSDAVDALLKGTTTGKERWCSICPTPALYKCCKPSTSGKGCGLKLCETCMVSLKTNNGDLQATLRGIKDEPSDKRLLGLRADSEFLRQDGLLMRYVLWESESMAAGGR